MFWSQVSSIFDAIRPVYRAGRLLGIFLNTIDFQRHVLMRTTQDQVVLVLSVLVDVYALSLSTGRTYIFSNSILLNVGIYCSVILGFIISLAIPLCNLLHGKRMFGIFKTLANVDAALERHGYRLNHQLNHMFSCIFLTTPIVVNFLMMITTFTVSRDPASQTLTYLEIVVFMRSSLAFTIFGSYVCVTLTSILLRFRGLNKVFSTQFSTSLISFPQIAEKKDTSVNVSLLRCFGELHEQLCECILDFNNCFSLQILFMMASALGYTLFSVFGIIHALSQLTADDAYGIAMNNMIYGSIYLTFIIQVVVIGSLTTSQVKRTAVMVHKVFCYGSCDRNMVRQLNVLSHQFTHNAPKVSCLLFDFEWPFLGSVTSFLFMHIVILVQFDLSNIASNVSAK